MTSRVTAECRQSPPPSPSGAPGADRVLSHSVSLAPEHSSCHTVAQSLLGRGRLPQCRGPACASRPSHPALLSHWLCNLEQFTEPLQICVPTQQGWRLCLFPWVAMRIERTKTRLSAQNEAKYIVGHSENRSKCYHYYVGVSSTQHKARPGVGSGQGLPGWVASL